MLLFEFDGKALDVHPTAFAAPTATLVGGVVLEEALVANGCPVLAR